MIDDHSSSVNRAFSERHALPDRTRAHTQREAHDSKRALRIVYHFTLSVLLTTPDADGVEARGGSSIADTGLGRLSALPAV
jgi:hypothetical protein